MNMSIENIVCVHRVDLKESFEQLTLAVASSSSRCHGSPDILGDRHVENTVNLKSASFVTIMLLHKGLTHIHSQKKPRFQFGESFTLMLC